MTRNTSARIAGFSYLLYIATYIPALLLFDRVTSLPGIAAKLARIGEQASDVRLVILLLLVDCLIALALGIGLYGITRDEDHEIALVALSCRVGEGVIAAIPVLATVGLLWLATSATAAGAPDTAAAHALAALLLKLRVWATTVAATFFAVGSTLFCWLLLRGRIVPIPLAWFGIVASVLLVFSFPAELIGTLRGPISFYVGMPMLVFEIVLGLWLLIKGVPSLDKRESREESR